MNNRPEPALLHHVIISLAAIILCSSLGCTSVSTLPGEQLSGANRVYLVGLPAAPYMIYLTAEEPRDHSPSFSLAHRVTASSTLLYPATIRQINNAALLAFQKVLNSNIKEMPKKYLKSKKSRHNLLRNNLDCNYYIQLKFIKNHSQAQAVYRISGHDFLRGAWPVYPQGSRFQICFYIREKGRRSFRSVYKRSLNLFPAVKTDPESLAPLTDAFIWHSAYASGEKELRFDFHKHITILRSSVRDRIITFLKEEAARLEKALK